MLQAYRVSLKQIGARAHLEDPKSPEPIKLRVEFASGIQLDTVKSYARSGASTFFPEFYGDDTLIEFLENNRLTGGIRMFYGDDMVDVSFQKFVNELR